MNLFIELTVSDEKRCINLQDISRIVPANTGGTEQAVIICHENNETKRYFCAESYQDIVQALGDQVITF